MKPPIEVLHLFPEINNLLVSFLKRLRAEDWQKQTVAKQWVVKDVASHLLDGNLRQISLKRDHWFPGPNVVINNNDDLVNYLNRINGDWVKASKRLSPQVITELLESTNKTVYELFSQLDLFAPSTYPVSWAGESMSYNWFDLAREYTERWLHQQQIREAVGNKDILTKELYYPLLNIFLQAWPYTAGPQEAADGTILKTTITGKGGGEWYLVYIGAQWTLSDKGEQVTAETIIDGDIAWKLFSKSVRKEDIPGKFEVKGDARLGEIVLNMISVMA